MNNTKTDKSIADLRLRAEEKLRLADSKAAGYLTPEQALQMVHELQVHQIELEMQNEELRTAQIELEASRARYFDLYDLAPVGYFTLSHEDLVLEANFTAAEILGMTRSTIIDQPITHFIFPADQDIYYKLKKQLPKKKSQQASCEIRLIKKGDGPLWVRLVQTASHDSQNNVVYRVVITDITDRIELSQELEAQNVKLEAIFENVLEGIIICSLDGVLQKWNPAALSMHGFANEREGQQDISHFFSLFELSDPSGQILAPDQWPVPRILRGEKLSALELNVRRIDQNTVRIFSYHGSIIRNPAGEPYMAVLIARDITHYKQAESKIKELALFPQQNPEPVMRIDATGILLYGNPASAGFQESWKFGLGTKVPAPWMSIIESCFAKNKPKRSEMMVGDKTYELTFTPVTSLGYINIYGFDISERKWIEGELKSARNQLEKIVQEQKQEISATKQNLNLETEGRLFAESELSHRQEALEAVYTMQTAFDSNIDSLYDQVVLSICTTLNLPSVAIYEYRDGKMIRGSQCIKGRVVRKIHASAPCAVCLSVLSEKRTQQFSGDMEKQFDTDFCFDPAQYKSYAGIPIIGLKNEVFGIVTILDHDKRQFTEYEIKFVEIFGRYIAHELSSRDLEQRLRRAEEMRILGQLTAGVAHEVRNPLNGILAIMGALSKELADETRFAPYMQHLRSQVTRLTELMEDLLLLGRPIRTENLLGISMVTIVENTLQTWLQTLQSPKPSIRFVKPEDSGRCMILADSKYITQVIINLLENAHNHSPKGEEIVCTVNQKVANTVLFSVSDSGTGIAEAILPNIFNPFFTTRKGGTGLGLCIVRNIVENHQGSIMAYNNTDGPGATFTVVFPLFVEE